MKLLLIHLSILLLGIISCTRPLNKNFEQHSELFLLNINEINKKTDEIRGKIQERMEDMPIATMKWFNKSNLTTRYCNKTNLRIDSIINHITSQTSNSASISKKEIRFLIKEIKSLKDSLIILIEDKTFNKLLTEHLEIILNPNNFNNIRAFNSKKVNKDELIIVLLKLKQDITYTELAMISSFFTNVGSPCGRFIKLEPHVFPKSEIIKRNQNFEAEIHYANVDTSSNYTYEIEGKTYDATGGVSYYKHKVTEEPGIISKRGRFIIKMPRTGKDSILPFEIKYKVLPN